MDEIRFLREWFECKLNKVFLHFLPNLVIFDDFQSSAVPSARTHSSTDVHTLFIVLFLIFSPLFILLDNTIDHGFGQNSGRKSQEVFKTRADAGSLQYANMLKKNLNYRLVDAKSC